MLARHRGPAWGEGEVTMLRGAVNFEATIKGNGISFPSFEFNPDEPSVNKVEIECP
jgi:hypothetical protein